MSTLRTAIAPTFTLSVAETFELSFPSGTSPVTVTIPAASYRMVLAPAASDYVRVVTAAINSALTGASRSEVALVVVDPTTMEATIAIATVTWSAVEVTGTPLRRLGFNATIGSSATNAFGLRPVLHIATFVERVHTGWQSQSVVSAAETLGGVQYGITSGVRRDEDELSLGFIPRDPDFRASLGVAQTALYPAAQYAFSLGTVAAREWSVLDVVTSALGQPVAFALGTWQTLSSSTSDYYDIGAIKGESIMSPRIDRTRDGWDAYYGIGLGVTRSSTGTRA